MRDDNAIGFLPHRPAAPKRAAEPTADDPRASLARLVKAADAANSDRGEDLTGLSDEWLIERLCR